MKALILHATGTNRDGDAAKALELAGAEPCIVHINQLKAKEKNWTDYSMLVIPGGFSYADALGAGKLFALDLQNYFFDEVSEFILTGKPVIGICNGFQVLVKSGLLPGWFSSKKPEKDAYKDRKVSLTNNKQGRFECRFTTMIPQKSKCIWTKDLTGNLTCPLAHGEGRFLTDCQETADKLFAEGQVALRYGKPINCKTETTAQSALQAVPANGEYPFNPNGSVCDIAGICNSTGTVFGLMPHPENNVVVRERDSEETKANSRICLDMWKAGVKFASSL